MLRRLRDALTFSNVTASIALFIALGGASYAAISLPKNSVGSRQIKRNAVTGSKLKAGSVERSDLSKAVRSQLRRTGARGPAGPKGDTGVPGPLLDALPSGKTLRGAYAASGVGTGAGATVRDAPSFALPLTVDWTSHVIPVGGPSTAACPGDVDSPQAAPGQLCVYEGFSSNATLVVDGPSSTGTEPGADRFGWIAQITSTATGAYQSRGTWAVTQP